jgi:hypothetical protein
MRDRARNPPDTGPPADMGRIRSMRRFGGWLALFALALQLTLSFGHIHAEDFAPAQTSVAASDAGHSGANHNSGSTGRDHDDCPICATIYLLATLVMPLPPLVALPADHVSIVPADFGSRYLAPAASPRLFQARAPPQA